MNPTGSVGEGEFDEDDADAEESVDGRPQPLPTPGKPGAASSESSPEEQARDTERLGYADHGARILLHGQPHQSEGNDGYPDRDVLHGDAQEVSALFGR